MMRWLDPERLRVDIRWHGCSGTTRMLLADSAEELTAVTLDTFTEDWGFVTIGSRLTQWMVLDTR